MTDDRALQLLMPSATICSRCFTRCAGGCQEEEEKAELDDIRQSR